MKMDYSIARLTIVVAPIDLRAGFMRLATIAKCLLGIPVTKGGHFVAFIGKHRQICKVICAITKAAACSRANSTRDASSSFSSRLRRTIPACSLQLPNSRVFLTANRSSNALEGSNSDTFLIQVKAAKSS